MGREDLASAQGMKPGDTSLRDLLREWRRETAKEQKVAAFVIMHDSTLDDLCKVRPSSMNDLLRVSGIGHLKAEKYGREILETLRRFRAGERATPVLPKKATAPVEVAQLIQQGRTLDEISEIRGRRRSTIVSMVSKLVEERTIEFQPGWITAERQPAIEAACEKLGLERCSPLKDALPPEFTYDEIRLVVAYLRSRHGGRSLAVTP